MKKEEYRGEVQKEEIPNEVKFQKKNLKCVRCNTPAIKFVSRKMDEVRGVWICACPMNQYGEPTGPQFPLIPTGSNMFVSAGV